MLMVRKITPRRARRAVAKAASTVGLPLRETHALLEAMTVGARYRVGAYGGPKDRRDTGLSCPALALYGRAAYGEALASWALEFDRQIGGAAANVEAIEIIKPRWWAPWR